MTPDRLTEHLTDWPDAPDDRTRVELAARALLDANPALAPATDDDDVRRAVNAARSDLEAIIGPAGFEKLPAAMRWLADRAAAGSTST